MKKKANFATIAMPVFLLVVILSATLIIYIFSISVRDVIKNSEETKIKNQIEKIVTEAENMYEYAESGTILTINVDFPKALRFIIFGGLPTNGNNEPTNMKINEQTSNNYYYVISDNRIFTYSSNARFSGFSIDEMCLLEHGNYCLKIELVQNDGRSYVKIYRK